jgi:four helix bundle protein
VAYQHFTEMPVWQSAHKLVLLVYHQSNGFPKEEQYALISQIRRAAVSVSSNIAEGFGRQHSRDKAQFYYNARGSLYEVENQALIARDLGYLSSEGFHQVKEPMDSIMLDLNKIIKTLVS